MNLDTLIAIEEIRQLMARYARLADAKRWADVAGLFTPDGTFNSYAVDGSPVAEMSGRDVIEETLTSSTTGRALSVTNGRMTSLSVASARAQRARTCT